jgi:two-component system, LuxR family, sensor kinase FixL
MAIPAVLIFFVRRRRDMPFTFIFWMFGAFIISCGFTHFMEVVIFHTPLYRLSGLVKLFTAVVSLATVVALVPLVPKALALRSPEELEREITERKHAEDQLRQARDELEERVRVRTADLVRVNEALRAEVAERKQAEEALQREQDRYRSLVLASAQIVWTTNPEGEMVEDSPSWRAFTGQTYEQLKGQGWLNTIHPDDRERTQRAWATALTTGTVFQIEDRVKRADGVYRHTAVRGVPVLEPDGGLREWVGMNTDVTELKEAEDAIRQARDDLEVRVRERTGELARANRELERSNQELQSFASVASHDLQEPLRKIQAFGDILQSEHQESLGEEGRDFLGRMQAAAGRMSTLISDLLTFSRVTTKGRTFVPVDLGVVAREVVSDLEARLRETSGRVNLGDLPTIDADPTQMRQLLQNLIGNALKFHLPEKTPTVQVGGELLAIQEGNRVCRLTVTDNGIGFDEKYTDRIFEVFQRLHGRSQYEGTGIGLAICKKIVERHGGSITATSTPGWGTTFVVALPVKKTGRE